MYFIKNKFDWVLCFLRLFIFNYWYFISSWNQTLCSANGIQRHNCSLLHNQKIIKKESSVSILQ